MPPTPKPTAKQVAEWKEALIRDHPQVDPYFVELLLEVYREDPGYVEAAVKAAKKKASKMKVVGASSDSSVFEAKTVEIIPADQVVLPKADNFKLEELKVGETSEAVEKALEVTFA